MASVTVTEKMRKEATCSICLNLMTEPVSINCEHSFCHMCIEENLKKQRHVTSWLGTYYCPQCVVSFKRGSIRPNKQLQIFIDYIKEIDHKMLCEEHREQLNIFCEDDGQLICWRCERTGQHKGHLTAHVEDVCQGYKEELQKAMNTLKELEDKCKNEKISVRDQITTWEVIVEQQKQKIQSDFKTLYKFLHEEEKTYLWRLEKEKEETLRKLQDNEASLEKQSHELKSHIMELEKKCQGSAQKLLQDVKDTLSRSSSVKLKLPQAIPLKILTVCNVSELHFDMKKIQKEFKCDSESRYSS
ncbi:E3 ubiquitin-protein ligase TRIM38-like isoform X2 [Erinaceus europaeus]|uniref:E3 ubiquitin-protein ligase TRIM38-like isoform X2 n=1 Tax=Erinaceus europaeus TaxID=9365 RepID=A0ABM3X8V8_ERIEU|nr:E3 ubiquitin-protein ligase TRIM38-like isoform X2 [Erinaceus europaeus]